jgi:hypothetical protein
MLNQQAFLSNIERLSKNYCGDAHTRSDVKQAELAHCLVSLFTSNWAGCAVRTDFGLSRVDYGQECREHKEHALTGIAAFDDHVDFP